MKPRVTQIDISCDYMASDAPDSKDVLNKAMAEAKAELGVKRVYLIHSEVKEKRLHLMFVEAVD